MIRLNNINVQLSKFALKNIDLHVEKGEFYSLLGPTGSGKSMLLETIAGLKNVKSGNVIIDKIDKTKEKPENRNISIVYQDFALFPNMTVEENIKYGLRFKENDPKYEENYYNLIKIFNIEHITDRYPKNLSGGEKQRTSLARGLVVEPKILLLDEPFSALDNHTKKQIMQQMKEIHKQFDITILMVTHNFSEVYYLADKVAIIDDGEIIQVNEIEKVFNQPENKFVAQFTGMENIFERKDIELGLPEELSGDPYIYAGIRPENIHLGNEICDLVFEGTIIDVYNNGTHLEVTVEYNNMKFIIFTINQLMNTRLKNGEAIQFGFNKKDVCYIK
ncbi:molybdate/tungstate transport system ATP-binding protein [Dethiosulfatibacter aminovorans DSM 17477]|uniref:ABC-type quaternary amine transporter n=1 Tax=Dethiosulfatibacter aminovorans DSM 17477 TaxID=1121476 RepID=A0A1M6H0K1_9FIRM|nr:ATP-binding cassette domain-containing protein [Dethiosulfatibacter aminovorans]SHJ15737.1 molybdate/tungstate transport system ATP-binding protein [Dethiosulfatibacter aminovorans DSM 17477]